MSPSSTFTDRAFPAATLIAVGRAAWANAQLLLPNELTQPTMEMLLRYPNEGEADSNGEGRELDSHDLAALADWASVKARCVPNPNWKRAYALIREGADLLLRRRARSSVAFASKSCETAVQEKVAQ